MSKPLAERYIHYDATDADRWRVLQPSEVGERALYFTNYTSSLAAKCKTMFGEKVEPTELERKFVDDASDFIQKTTGLTVDCGIGKFTKIGLANVDAAYIPSLHHIAVLDQLGGNGSEYGDKMELGSIFVHEMMHSTSVNTAKVVGIQNGPDHSIQTLQPHQLVEITSTFASDNFFEEGLAEEIASRWRMHYDPRLRYRETDLVAHEGHGALPVRMYQSRYPIDETIGDSERGYAHAAHCAFGIQLLSEYTGVDLIDLLIQARKPETQRSASQRIKETVDSLEPGLYDVLTSANYSLDDFQDTVEIIKQAIANHAHVTYSKTTA